MYLTVIEMELTVYPNPAWCNPWPLAVRGSLLFLLFLPTQFAAGQFSQCFVILFAVRFRVSLSPGELSPDWG